MAVTAPQLTRNAIFVFVSPGVLVDGGGFYVDANGHIHRIPPWDPQVRAALDAASALFAHASLVRDPEIGKQLSALGESIVQKTVPQLGKIAGGSAV